MRLWHKDLLPYLPDKQFKGQLRELVAIMRDWRDKGKTNHLLINRVMDYPKSHLLEYFLEYSSEYAFRYGKPIGKKIFNEFADFCGEWKYIGKDLFKGWHDFPYMKMCMVNLCEKYIYGKGSSRITDSEWATLRRGFYKVTGHEFVI